VAQVAALLDVTEDAVKKRLSRARATLRTALPDSVGRTLSATAPGAAFTAAVLSGLTAAAPATASASVLAASQGAAHAGIVAKLSLLLASVLPGALGGVAVVLAGTRHLTRDAFDDEERLGVRRFRLVGSLVVIVFALAFPTGSLLTGWRQWPSYGLSSELNRCSRRGELVSPEAARLGRVGDGSRPRRCISRCR
jgi:hypothetical protein